jgi:type II secretory pathway component PulM
MRKFAGIICLAAGVLLVAEAYKAAHEIGSKLQYVLTGNVSVRARYLLLGGGALLLLGVLQVFAAKR